MLVKPFLIVSMLLLCLGTGNLHAQEPPTPIAKAGLLDLRDWDFNKHGSISLAGEWAFFWQRLYQISELADKSSIKPDAFFPVPGRWGGFVLDNGDKVPAKGYATLYLRVLMPNESNKLHEQEKLRLFLGSSDASFQLQAYDTSLKPLHTSLSGGRVSNSAENYRPMWVRDSSVIDYSQEILLLWHISNFDMLYDGGGPKKAPVIGLDKQITLAQENERSFNAVTTGIMLIMAIYHLIIFSMRVQETPPLWFGLTCFFMALYSILTPHYLEQNFPQQLGFEFLTKLLFLAGVFAFTCNLLFIKSLFPQHAGKYLWKILVILTLCYSFLIALTPLSIYDYFRPSMGIIATCSAFWFLSVFSKAIFREKSIIAILVLIGFSAFGITSLSDSLVANAIISLPYLSAYGLSVYVLFQALVIAIQNQQTHKEKFEAQKAATESKQKALNIEQEALQQQKLLTLSFQRFVPKDFLKLLGKEKIQDVQLGDYTKREMSVLFSDIRSFTTLSESMSPEDNFKFLNSYLKRMEPLIHKNNGVIDKYIGDAIMATFPDSPDTAIQAAIDMIQALKEYNTHRKHSNYPPINIGIGINTGELMLGTIGGDNRMEGTVISDAVNLAARLESLTKLYGASIAISAQTLEKASLEKYQTRILDVVIVKGKSEPVTIYEILNAEEERSKELKLQSNEFLLKAIDKRREGQLDEALQALKIGLSFFPEDLTLKQHIEDIKKLQLLGLPENWQGAMILDNK